jgi:hypothetical protein
VNLIPAFYISDTQPISAPQAKSTSGTGLISGPGVGFSLFSDPPQAQKTTHRTSADTILNNLFIDVPYFREKAEEFRINPVGYGLEVLWTILELDLVHIHDEEVTVIFLDPVLVTLVEAGKVVDPDAALIFPAPLLDLRDQVRDG